MRKLFISILSMLVFVSCDRTDKKHDSVELVVRRGLQDSLYNGLMNVSKYNFPDSIKFDSLAFLVLPLEESCPSCRKKTIDSLLKYKNNLLIKHFVVIVASGGYKTMNRFFRELGSELPKVPDKIILDSARLSRKLNLYSNNPCMYYAFNGKVYKKVSAFPATIREDLREFFTGRRQIKEKS